jgi:hypothetical protein
MPLGATFNEWTVIGGSQKGGSNLVELYYPCRCSCGFEIAVRGSDLRSGKSRSCVNCAYRDEIPPGTKFGKWVVMELSARKISRGLSYLCACECGTQLEIAGGSLRYGHTTQCRSCANVQMQHHPTVDVIHGSYFNRLLRGANNRGIKVEIGPDDLLEQWNLQSGFCALSGKTLHLQSKTLAWSNSNASVDRINSSIGYLKDNIQWVDKSVNRLKNNLSEEELFELCGRIYRHKEYTRALRSKGAYKPWLLMTPEELELD